MFKILIIFIHFFIYEINIYATNNFSREQKEIIEIYTENINTYTLYKDVIFFDRLYKIENNQFEIKNFMMSNARANQSIGELKKIINNQEVIFRKINPRRKNSQDKSILLSFKTWTITVGEDEFFCFLNTNTSKKNQLGAILPKYDETQEPVYLYKHELYLDEDILQEALKDFL